MNKIQKLLLLSNLLLTSCQQQTINSFDDYIEDNYCYTNTNNIFSSPFPIIGQIKSINAYYKNNNQYTKLESKSYPYGTNLIYSLYSNKKIKSTQNIKDIESIIGNYTHYTHQLFDENYYYFDENNSLINNLKVINDNYASNQWITIDKELFTLLKIATELTINSNGKFNIFIGELANYWKNYISLNLYKDYNKTLDPEQDKLTQEKILSNIDNQKQQENIKEFLNNNQKDKLEQLILDTPQAKDINDILEFDSEHLKIKFNKFKNAKKVSITLGGIAKGYLIENLYQKFKNQNLTDGAIYAGASSIIFMDNIYSQNKTIEVQITNPYNIYEQIIGILNIKEKYSLSTSGSQNNSYYTLINNIPVLRHHIINSSNGYPSTNYNKITLISKKISSTIMDALSTILINCDEKELEKMIQYIRKYYGDLECILAKRLNPTIQSKEVNVYLTKGLQNSYLFTETTSTTNNDSMTINYYYLNY